MGRKLILLVDDDRDTLEAYTALFQALGHAIAAATEGPAAVAAALQLRPDLMVLDLGLPHMSGIEVLRRIRGDANGSRIPVIVLTGRAFPDDVARVREYGCSKVLIKPCEPAVLCRAVEDLLHAPLEVQAPAEGTPRRTGALRVRLPKPPRAGRPRPVENLEPRNLESLCLWADFLGRRSEALRERAAELIAEARDVKAWSSRLSASRT